MSQKGCSFVHSYLEESPIENSWIFSQVMGDRQNITIHKILNFSKNKNKVYDWEKKMKSYWNKWEPI